MATGLVKILKLILPNLKRRENKGSHSLIWSTQTIGNNLYVLTADK
jgi:hypothetical protein